MYYNAFWELSTCRQVGISLGPIPWNVIQYYGREKDYSEEQIEALQYHIRRMDGEYIKFLEKKNKGTK